MNMVRLLALASAIVFSATLSASVVSAQTPPAKPKATQAKKPPAQASRRGPGSRRW